MRFSRSLKENSMFRRLYAKGRSAAGPYLVVYCRRNGTDGNRVGITASKKLGHAVVRNRVRRRLREIYRLHEEEFLRGWDIVVVARSRAVGAPYAKLERAYLSLAQKLNLLAEKGDHPEDTAP
ncbi:MAG: ribonuclease P protein component [Oscillospiraceae bacterium]|nr:ribonuclease P protein component [Oscillospiraceae bacterium]